MSKMAESNWHQHFIDLLKFLETHGNPVREFRRSYISGSKKDRVYPRLTEIYEECKDKLDDTFIEWFNLQSFRIKSGLKIITLKCETNTELFEQYLRQLFTYWDPTIKFTLPESNQESQPSLISKKKMKKAMQHLGNMDSKQLAKTMALAPKNQMGALAENPEIQALAEQMQNNPTAKRLVQKLESKQ